jgi:uncharacterized damage-inducible protein DinB
VTQPLPTLGIPLLFDYLYWLRDRVLRAAGQLEAASFRQTRQMNGRDLRGTLVHELDVELSWRGRLRGEPPEAWGPEAGLDPKRYPTVASLVAQWRTDETEMRTWIGGLDGRTLARPVTANGLEGYPLSIYLLHVVEHGVTEFTSAAAILTELGLSPGELGVLNALDDLAPLPRPGDGPAAPWTSGPATEAAS